MCRRNDYFQSLERFFGNEGFSLFADDNFFWSAQFNPLAEAESVLYHVSPSIESFPFGPNRLTAYTLSPYPSRRQPELFCGYLEFCVGGEEGDFMAVSQFQISGVVGGEIELEG